MPATVEVICDNTDCELDMFEVHYTYDVPEDHETADLVCPYCTEAAALEEIEL
jgi:aspartate carbamoyltransferase regulatory subunit